MKNTDKKINEIESLIINNDLELAIIKMIEFFRDFNDEILVNEGLLLLSRMKNFSSKANSGVIDYFDPEFGKIRYSTITLKSSIKKLLKSKNKYSILKHKELVSKTILDEDFSDNKNETTIPTQFGVLFDVESENLVLTYKSIEEAIHESRAHLTTKMNNVDNVNQSFHWTGDSYKLESLTDDMQIIKINKTGFFDYYKLVFNRFLKKGEKIEIGKRFYLNNQTRKAKPTFRCSPSSSTKKLTMKIIFLNELKVKFIELKVIRKNLNVIISNEKKELVNGRFEWKINPIKGHDYEISWKW